MNTHETLNRWNDLKSESLDTDTAKKVRAGLYFVRGHQLERCDFLDADATDAGMWRVTAPNERDIWDTHFNTLADAKAAVLEHTREADILKHRIAKLQDARHAITETFLWKDTDEGEKYWSDVMSKLYREQAAIQARLEGVR